MTTLARNWPKTALGLGFVSSRSLLLLLCMSEFEETTAWRREYPQRRVRGHTPRTFAEIQRILSRQGSHRKARKKEKDHDVFTSYLSLVYRYLLLNVTVTPPLMSPILIVLQLCKFMVRHSNIARFLAKIFKFLWVRWPSGCRVLSAHLEGVSNKLSRCYGRLIISKTAYILPRTQTSLYRWKCASKGRREGVNGRDSLLSPSHGSFRFDTSRSCFALRYAK